MNTKNLVAYNKPYLTHKYSRKIRLLLTNKCKRNCPFCHNEGMTKKHSQDMDIVKIIEYFGEFKKITNRVVLTGGEPLLYPQMDKLLYHLAEYGFDITIDTAISNLSNYYHLLHLVNDIHISFLDYDAFDLFSENIESLFLNVPSIKVAINMPLYDEATIIPLIPKFRELSHKYGIRLQLIKIFNPEIHNKDDWNHRWDKILRLFHYENLFLIDATERESSFISQDNNLIDFIDIPCEMAGKEFSNHSCMNEMDITITPDLNIQFCRWSSNTTYPLTKPNAFVKDISNAFELSMENCRCGKAENDIYSYGLNQYAFLKHYTWPPSDNSFVWKINQQITCSQTSYFGKEGYIRFFENNFAKRFGTNYALSLCSGATAFYVACKAIGIGEGTKVILPVYSYPGLMTALIQLKAEVILCDVESHTGNISLEAFREIANKDIYAVVITHLWGKPVDISKFQNICKTNDIYIIEDGSHAFGAECNHQPIGSIGDIAFFSLQSNKVIYAGEGGIITTNNRIFYEKAVMYSMLKKRILDCIIDKTMLIDDESGWGLKLKLNPLGAVMACYSLDKLDEINNLRKKNYSIFANIISNTPMFTIPRAENDSERVFYTFKLLLTKEYLSYRDILVDRLIRRGLDVSISSFRPLHKLNITHTYVTRYSHMQVYPNADFYAERVISIPSFTYEDTKLVEFYAKTIVEEANNLLEERFDENCNFNCSNYGI